MTVALHFSFPQFPEQDKKHLVTGEGVVVLTPKFRALENVLERGRGSG